MIKIQNVPLCPRTPVIGKHKVPRFIYHLTSKSAYNSIKKSGFIFPYQDDLFGAGIFAVELTNLFKIWSRLKSRYYYSLIEKLVEHAAKGEDELVILRIPTDKLDKRKLSIRSQNIMLKCFSSKMTPKIDNFINLKMEEGLSEAKAVKFAVDKICPKLALHLEYGEPASKSSLFKQRKEAIEYIYPYNISINDAKKIGEINLKEFVDTPDYNPKLPMRSIFSKLLNGTPEQKGVDLINC